MNQPSFSLRRTNAVLCSDRSILIFLPQQQPELRHGNDTLAVLDGVQLQLTAEQVFSWLMMGYGDRLE